MKPSTTSMSPTARTWPTAGWHAMSRPTTTARIATSTLPHRGLVGWVARSRHPRDVNLGTLLRIRSRTRATPRQHRLPPDRRGRHLLGVARGRRRDSRVWWGRFFQELWVEHGEERYGPYDPVGEPVPLHRYRKHRKSRREVRADRVDDLATRIGIPRSVLSGEADVVVTVLPLTNSPAMLSHSFVDPDRFAELTFAIPLKARMAIADELRLPLGSLGEDHRSFIDALLACTLSRSEVMGKIRRRFPTGHKRSG